MHCNVYRLISSERKSSTLNSQMKLISNHTVKYYKRLLLYRTSTRGHGKQQLGRLFTAGIEVKLTLKLYFACSRMY